MMINQDFKILLKEARDQERGRVLDKFKEVIRLHDEDELLYPDLYNEFLVIYKSLRREES